MLAPSNTPHVALAQEWLLQLDQWVDAHGLCGPDPFDVKQHPLIRALQGSPLPRKASSVLTDLFPTATRRILGVAPTENPKAHALVAMGKLRLHALTNEAAFLDTARVHLQWLLENSEEVDGLAWGYPFAVRAQGLAVPPNTPVAVVCATAGEAFLRAAQADPHSDHLAHAGEIARYLREALPFLDGPEDTGCFAYGAGDARRVHNASLLVAAFLMRFDRQSGKDAPCGQSMHALAFSLDAQREDGAWPYGAVGEGEAFEPGLMALVDHHHTGFVLRALHDIQTIYPNEATKQALKRGVRYYREKLFTGSGIPRTEHGRYPVDIHACAEALICCAQLMGDFPGLAPLPQRTLKWTYNHLRRRRDNAPFYRRYPFVTSHLVAPRWGVAWMYRALADLVTRFQGNAQGVLAQELAPFGRPADPRFSLAQL